MGQPELIKDFATEAELADFAASFGRVASVKPLLIGLRGALGSGKTTWARALLRGLGYTGRVPSPTYTLLEHYTLAGLIVVHLDLYRLAGDEALENLGLRDWLADARVWMLVEWPERAPGLLARCDIVLEFLERGEGGRRIVASAATRAGIEALRPFCQGNSN